MTNPVWMPRLARLWDRITLSLPVLLMGLLALGSYWLVRSTPVPEPAATAAAAAQGPDHVMRDFSVRRFDATGRLQSEVFGTQARHFTALDRIEIDQPRIRSLDAAGRLTVATARKAISNEDGSQVQLIGDARVQRQPVHAQEAPTEFRGEWLLLNGQTQRLRSDRPVQWSRGPDRFSADSLDYDHVERVAELRGRVRVSLAARGGGPGAQAPATSKEPSP